MKTEQGIKGFLEQAQAAGKSPRTINQYSSYLRRFAASFRDLPTEPPVIEGYLKAHKETPAHRGMHFNIIQAFYTYLARSLGISSPVPARGKIGRHARDGSLAGAKLLSSIPDHIDTCTADLIEKYQVFKKAEGVSKRTIDQYNGKLGAFAKAFPALPLDPDIIAKFLGELEVDPETRWDYRKHIISLYHFLERRQIIPIITPNFPRVKLQRKTRRVLSEPEVMKLFDVADRFEDKVILTLLIDSKIRASELCSLTRENVFQDHILVTGKTGQRRIPISPLTFQMIDKLNISKGLLFTIEGRPMRREYLRIRVREIMEKAGLTGKRLGPHILRHSSSVFHIMHGGDLLSLQKELGHTSLKMTERYAQLAFTDVKQRHQEVNVIGRFAAGPQKERALCFGCNAEIQVQVQEVKSAKCPKCGQVGRWYLPEVPTERFQEIRQ